MAVAVNWGSFVGVQISKDLLFGSILRALIVGNPHVDYARSR